MTSERAGFPTATARQYRVRLFQPTRRPVQLEEAEFSTKWGRVWVTGRLGQQHADVLDAMMFDHIDRSICDGRIKLLVDPFKVRRRACLSSHTQLKQIVSQLIAAVIKLDLPETDKARSIQCEGHIIDHRAEAIKKSTGLRLTRPNPIGQSRRHPRESDKEDRALWRVELGKAFVQLIEGDVWLGYDPAPIAALQHGVSQAIVRHIKTHSRVPAGGWHLDGLIDKVCGARPEAVRDRRRELREDRELLARMGIRFDGNRVTVEQIPGRVEQIPGRVEQIPGRVEQIPGAWSKYPGVAGFSGYSEAGVEVARS